MRVVGKKINLVANMSAGPFLKCVLVKDFKKYSGFFNLCSLAAITRR